MPRTLDTPEVQPDAVQQHISGMRFEIPAVRNVGDTAMEISKNQVRVWFEVITYDAAGLIIDKQTHFGLFADWPAAFLTDVKSVYSRIAAYAENLGLIVGPGTDEPLE
jgi:hypothetical protein